MNAFNVTPRRAFSLSNGLTGVGGKPFTDYGLFGANDNGFLFNFSKTDRLLQDIAGTTAVAVDTDPIALPLDGHSWGGKTLPQFAAGQPNIAPAFVPAGTGWSVTNSDATHKVIFGSGSAQFQVSSSSPLTILGATVLTSGKTYQLSGQITAAAGGQIKFDVVGASITLPATTGPFSYIFTANSSVLGFYRSGAGVTDITLGNLTLKEIPGNHGLQATASARPFWKTPNFARLDGVDDNWLTTLNPGGDMTLAVKMKAANVGANRVAIGSASAAANSNLDLGISSGGVLRGSGGGTQLTSTAGISGVVCVGVLVVSGGSALTLYLNGAPAATGNTVGAVNTTVPLRIGAYNSNGTAIVPISADIYNVLAINRALTPAEVINLTNSWGTT
jgi:hypothetical protein